MQKAHNTFIMSLIYILCSCLMFFTDVGHCHPTSVSQIGCSYTFLVPKQVDNSSPVELVASGQNGEEIENLKSLVQLLTQNVNNLQKEIGILKEVQNSSSNNGDTRVGTNYVRWGRTECPQTSHLVYEGLTY